VLLGQRELSHVFCTVCTHSFQFGPYFSSDLGNTEVVWSLAIVPLRSPNREITGGSTASNDVQFRPLDRTTVWIPRLTTAVSLCCHCVQSGLKPFQSTTAGAWSSAEVQNTWDLISTSQYFLADQWRSMKVVRHCASLAHGNQVCAGDTVFESDVLSLFSIG
jgi:hypothetical protein